MFSLFDKLKQSLSKTKEAIAGKIAQVVTGRKIDQDLLDDLEEALIGADVGVAASTRLINSIKDAAKKQNLTEGDQVTGLLKSEIAAILERPNRGGGSDTQIKPVVWLITGVNGVGKTTTIGKLATLFASQGKKVMIAACDTF
ncbi:MAG: signal recognition particle receptor subunit alpha, partial [candidate division Zixibacteria bacterium]|nr:signal recognition particle receptor subunit alpha [candidate division Zixibacteria bacterium]